MVVADDRACAEYIEPYIREVVSYFHETNSYLRICCFFYESWSDSSKLNKRKLTKPPKSNSNKRNGVGPDNPKGSKSSDMDQNQKDDLYSIAYSVVAVNDMS
ncbi:hypothetical protein R3W88_028059 [Solanum pinnatisectum]|uniref:Uncharacterized protein n=1 Tax=Solanum pinnatisectum TaxID=50273 RepID=A0AAV9LKE4_9SOLN|nr:hypothetical protein R3W88_028059 [Solanum pinnatisectum]